MCYNNGAYTSCTAYCVCTRITSPYNIFNLRRCAIRVGLINLPVMYINNIICTGTVSSHVRPNGLERDVIDCLFIFLKWINANRSLLCSTREQWELEVIIWEKKRFATPLVLYIHYTAILKGVYNYIIIWLARYFKKIYKCRGRGQGGYRVTTPPWVFD